MAPWKLLALILVTPALSSASDTFAVQGRLANAAGLSAPDGIYGLTFSVWTAETGGERLWEEAHTSAPGVAVVDGVFSLSLGNITAIGAGVFAGGARWLEVQVVPELAMPRRRIDSVPTALVARALDCTGCVPPSALSVLPATASDLAALSAAFDAHAADPAAHGPGYTDTEAVAAVQSAPGLTLSGRVNFASKGSSGLRLETAGADPVTCSLGEAGYLYFNTTTRQVLVCAGDEFVPLVNEAPLGTMTRPARRCQEILSSGDSTGDGEYWLDLDGPTGSETASLFYCDMTNDGGGWTRIEGAKHPWFFNAANWTSTNPASPQVDNYSRLGLRSHFADAQGCWTWRITVGRSTDWKAAQDYATVWKQCHDAFTQTTNGTGYTFISGSASTTCGGFNGLHARYASYSYTSDVDSGDVTGCWYMQMVPSAQYGGAPGYLDGYGGQVLDRKWQSMWLR
jgi:hypothetical protein